MPGLDRATLRQGIATDKHLALLDADVDEILAAVHKCEAECKREFVELRELIEEKDGAQNKRITKLMIVATNALVSTCIAVVLFVLNLKNGT